MTRPPTILDALDAAEREATAGPWHWNDDRDGLASLWGEDLYIISPALRYLGASDDGDEHFETYIEERGAGADSDLICLARNHLRSLIEVARAAEAYVRPDVWIEGHPLHGRSTIFVASAATTSETLRDALAPLLAPHEESS